MRYLATQRPTVRKQHVNKASLSYGTGRPHWTARNRAEAEEFFLGSLASWRQRMGIDKMVLVGHSMGGYLAAAYALKYPDHVAHLILVCPAGIVRASLLDRRP